MTYPALEVTGADAEMVLAIVDDYAPTAAEEHDSRLTIFFTSARQRDAARAAVLAAFPSAVIAVREIDDEDWARRSQEGLPPITVGRILITQDANRISGQPNPRDLPHRPNLPAGVLPIVVVPSMGFGTGHHATTRLCLTALQALPLASRTILDVGTGSGVLAMAGRALGAREALGIDVDSDAVFAANENLERNPAIDGVSFDVADIKSATLEPADIVTANLTGALLVTMAPRLLALVRPGGTLIVSGLLEAERTDVVQAFGEARLAWAAGEDGWVGLAFNQTARIEV